MPGKASDPGRTSAKNRQFANGVSWVLRSGALWQHLPKRCGNRKTVHTRSTRRAKKGIWEQILAALIAERDGKQLMHDAIIFKSSIRAVAPYASLTKACTIPAPAKRRS